MYMSRGDLWVHANIQTNVREGVSLLLSCNNNSDTLWARLPLPAGYNPNNPTNNPPSHNLSNPDNHDNV